MECLNVIITLLEAARRLPEQTGVNSFYLVLGGLVVGLIGSSVLITLLIWVRYLTGGLLVAVTIMGFNHRRRRLQLVREERNAGN